MKTIFIFNKKKISLVVLISFLSFIHAGSISAVTNQNQEKKSVDLKAENPPTPKVILQEGTKNKKKSRLIFIIPAAILVTGAILLLLKGKKKADTQEAIPPEIQWIDIPEGEFQMGDNLNEGRSDERPVHTVYLDAYKISKYEVTWEQYLYFCEKTGRKKPGRFESDTTWGQSNYPVTNVSWYDAQAYCEWLSEQTGNNIHLPTEAQWEKAARETDQRKYPWGNTPPTCELTNFYQCTYAKSPVGSYPAGASPYGVHDMAGNVFEWCYDRYDSTYYSISPNKNPQGPSNGISRVYRGGAYGSVAFNIRTTFRLHVAPQSSSHNIGIRLVRD